MTTQNTEPDYLKTKDVCAIFDVSRWVLDRLIEQEHLVAVKVGGAVRITAESVAEYRRHIEAEGRHGQVQPLDQGDAA